MQISTAALLAAWYAVPERERFVFVAEALSEAAAERLLRAQVEAQPERPPRAELAELTAEALAEVERARRARRAEATRRCRARKAAAAAAD